MFFMKNKISFSTILSAIIILLRVWTFIVIHFFSISLKIAVMLHNNLLCFN